MMKAAILGLMALACVATASEVVVLTSSNFDEVTKGNDYVLVEFFAPWCGHCKKLVPEYESAAKTLKDDNVILATVDATEEKELAGKFGIKGYPTLKFFRNGKATEYNGGRTADTIVSWLRKKTGPAAQELTDAASVEAFADLSKVAVVGFFADAQGAEYDAFVAAATDDDERAYGYSLDSATAEAQGASVPSVVLFKKFDEGKNVLEGSLTKKTVEEFVAKNSIPLVIPFTMDAVGQIFQSPLGKVAFLFSQTELPDFAAVATKYKGKLVFATSDGSVDRLNSHVGLEKSDFPKLVILETGAQMKKFPLTSASLDESSMSEHIDAYFAGDLKPWFKSEKAPADNSGPVTVIVGNNFNEIVLDETKDVLLEVYAPWCGHCKKLVPIYDELGEHFKSNPNIVIAKMDGTANEIDGLAVRGFPTIKFYPAGKKTAEGTEYQGGRELQDFKDFLAKNTKSAGHDEL